MAQLLFVRHAQTDLAGTFCGHTDPPVNQAGQEQIANLLETFDMASIGVIHTSDLRRAFTTALAVARHTGGSIVASEAFREIHFGDWEGLAWKEIEAHDPVFAQRWIDESPRLSVPNGEPVTTFERRVLAAVRSIQSTNRSAAIVTHAGVMRVVLRELCGLTEQQAWERTQSYCCTFTLDAASR